MTTTRSSIEWTEVTWNPITGCSKVSPGCNNCYAERMAQRLRSMGQPNCANEVEVTLHPQVLQAPLHWSKPRTVFVNSMGDLFHEMVPEKFIQDTFQVMSQASLHQFQILTKRSERLAEMSKRLDWTPNICMGVSVENAHYTIRIDHLRITGASIKFLSLEPLLGLIQNLILEGIGWVIMGGESGPNARPMNPSWVVEIRDRCAITSVPFFFQTVGQDYQQSGQAGSYSQGKRWPCQRWQVA